MKPDTIERLWFSRDLGARAVRAALLPAAALFRGASAVRNRLYDVGLLPQVPATLPAIAVGNLTVGGTGKTPVAAWIAGRLRSAGARPAIVLRGYGEDEPLVHALLTPGALVITDPDRARGLRSAAEQGADVAVLDDAFQHRRVRRAADVVLLSADRPLDRRWPLPAGPWREPLSALRRATLAVVTRKSADDSAVVQAIAAVRAAAPDVPVAVARLALGELQPLATASGAAPQEHLPAPTPAGRPLADVRGRRILAVAALGDPRAFLTQLEAAGARVTPLLFPDHHPFTADDVTTITRHGATHDLVVCTLKDAVKLVRLRPRAGENVWYVTQTVHLERGEEDVERVLADALSLRRAPS